MKPRMKRKRWSELEELTLLTKYADLYNSGTLSKLRTREKKFKPIADHLNSLHHLQHPTTFPFKWSWRDVSIKIQNMKHQYLGVKHKIRLPHGLFNWEDAANHWDNFFKYKDVFGDLDLDDNINKDNGDFSSNVDELFGENHGDDDFGLGFQMIDCDNSDEEEREEEGWICGDGEQRTENEGSSSRILLLCARVLELRQVLVKREETRKETDFSTEEFDAVLNESDRRKSESLIEKRVATFEEERLELEELEEFETRLLKRKFDRRQLWLERELEEERRWRTKMEEEEMEWKEIMLSLQLEHDKQIMQMHADASHNQMQIIASIMTRFLGPAADALLAGLHPHVLHHLHHPGPAGLELNHKPASDSPPHYI